MAATAVFSTFSKDFCWPSRATGIIGRDLKFAGYAPHYKILTGNIFGLILKNKIATTGISLSVMKSSYNMLLLVLEVCNVKQSHRKSWAGNLLMWSDLTLDPSFKVKQGYPNLKVLITRLLLVLVSNNNIYIDIKPYFCFLYRSILKYRVMDVFRERASKRFRKFY